MFGFFGKKKEAPKVVCHKCGAALRSDDTYMLNQQKYCGKCYQEEKKKSNETIPAKDNGHSGMEVKKESNISEPAASLTDQSTKENLQKADQKKEGTVPTSDASTVMDDSMEKEEASGDTPLLRYSAEMTANPSRCCFLKDRTASVISRFNAERIQNGTYLEESNSIPFQIEGTVTYDRQHGVRGSNFLDTITKVKTSSGEIQVYREEIESWWTNYHDESESQTTIVPIDSKTWDKEGWFSDPKWTSTFHGPKTKTPLPVPSTDMIPYDALYYEGYDRDGILIYYLRRCKEGYRLLKIRQKNTEAPVEIGFSEDDIQTLYQHISDNRTVTMFWDFLLNDPECAKINAYAECDKNPEKLPALNSYYSANPDKFVSFLRETGATETKTYSISSLMIQGLLHIR